MTRTSSALRAPPAAPTRRLATRKPKKAAAPAKVRRNGGTLPWGTNQPSLSEQSYSTLEEMIVTLKLPPGVAVSEAGLSRALGIGRTPIREALQRLAREGLVTILPRRGIIVTAVDIKSQLRLLEVRREVERLVVRSAARRAQPDERERFAELARTFEKSAQNNDETTFIRTDREFNELCTKSARNEFGAGAMMLMHSLSRRFWFIHYKQAADMPATAKLHADIAWAISKGDERAAAIALDRLIDEIEQFTRATVTTDI
ncbi:MAG: GntR family transcriptional regulator [Casimicrobiaceae bacterium]